jgi:hypothetical protein
MYRYVESEKIKLPYSIARVIKQQKRLLDDVPLKNYIGVQMTDSLILSAAEYLHWKLRKNGIPVSFYAETLDIFRNRKLQAYEFEMVLRRIAAVTEIPEDHRLPAMRWSHQVEDEWFPVIVLNVNQRNKEEQIYDVLCRVVGGRMIDIEFIYKISLKQAFRIATMSGFNQRSEVTRLIDPRQFVKLMLLLKVAKGSVPERVRILDCGEHGPIVTFNRRINKLRYHEFRVCKYRLNVPCFRCGVGSDDCPLAVIEHTDKDRLIFNTSLK